MKTIFLTLILSLTLLTAACSPIENDARDAAAALNGAIASMQTKYNSTCTTNPNQNVCSLIDHAVDGQNSLITAVETYCGWSTTNPPPDQLAKCVPVNNAKAGLVAAIANANQLTLELKGAF